MDYDTLIADPNVRSMLDMISSNEGTTSHGYHTLVGGSRFDSLADHPRITKRLKIRGESVPTSAAGRYQIIKGTWDGAVRALRKEGVVIDDFSPRSQDIVATYLMKQRGALGDVLKGEWRQAIGKLGTEWASLPSSNYNQPKVGWQATLAKLPGGAKFAGTSDVPAGAQPSAQPVQAPAVAAAPTDALASALAGLPAAPGVIAGPAQAATTSPASTGGGWQEAVLAMQQQASQPSALQEAALNNEVDAVRNNAVASFFGETPMPQVTLPKSIEDTINKYMAQLT